MGAVGLAFASVGCGDDGNSTSTTGTGQTASLTSAAITVTDLDVTNCQTEGASDIGLEAIKGSFQLQVDAPGGTGTISYMGGEQNAEGQGSVDSVTVENDGSFTVKGSWEGGGTYTLTGNCAGS